MKINLLLIDKTDIEYIKQGFDEYLKRLKFYTKLDVKIISTQKKIAKSGVENQKSKEAELTDKTIDSKSKVFLLDENGQQFSSMEFAQWINKQSASGQDITFIVGGPYGFADYLLQKFPKIALSKMTFSHQMVRLFFIEQLYRAFTILKGENYHHQ